MSDWYTVQKIDDQTFVITEDAHWGKVHCYLFIGQKKAALIDTGLGIENIREVVESLTSLPIIVLTTHHHIDHIGNHSKFKNIAIHEGDQELLEKGMPMPLEILRKRLFKTNSKPALPKNFDPHSYIPFTGKPTQVLKDKDEIDLGGRILQIIHTPGHTPGHICIYEKTTGYLATGDILYSGTLYLQYPGTDLIQFANSIKKLAQMTTITRILPGHHDLNISTSHLQETDEFFEQIKKDGKLLAGTGLHQGKNLAVLL